MRQGLSLLLLAACIVLYSPSSCFSENALIKPGTRKVPTLDLSLVYETKHSLETAFDYLISSQQSNGSWKNDPAITSLILYALLLEPSFQSDDKTDKAVKNGFAYVKKFVNPDGGIYDQKYKNYTTAVCLLAFSEAGKPEHKSIINDAKKFLISFQMDEGEYITKEHPFYGGIGYGGDDRPDLSNTQLALEAIKSAEIYEAKDKSSSAKKTEKNKSEPADYWRKALVFLARTQNIKSINDMPYATDDGGFIYETGHYNEDRSHSYGSMTYAGMKSLLFAGVDPNDIRIQKAYSWICRNYTVEENPGFGTVSLYYYYMTASKCLAVMGEEVITDSKGIGHPWREEFIKKLISLQHEDGYWVNVNGRYWENIKDLTTAYAVIGMKFALKDSKRPANRIFPSLRNLP